MLWRQLESKVILFSIIMCVVFYSQSKINTKLVEKMWQFYTFTLICPLNSNLLMSYQANYWKGHGHRRSDSFRKKHHPGYF